MLEEQQQQAQKVAVLDEVERNPEERLDIIMENGNLAIYFREFLYQEFNHEVITEFLPSIPDKFTESQFLVRSPRIQSKDSW